LFIEAASESFNVDIEPREGKMEIKILFRFLGATNIALI